MRSACGAVLTAAVLAGCAPRVQLPPGTLAPDRDLVLNGHALQLHFANPHGRADRPLLIYATGDGGWHRGGLDAWRHLAAWGYPAAGFDARDYVTHLGTATTTPARLAADYAQIIAAARVSLHLAPAYPVVLVGISRGAGLSVVAGGEERVRAEIAGVLAVALTAEEEYVGTPDMVRIYPSLPRLGDVALAVVQSTHDKYLSAAQARTLFGADRPRRRLISIDAKDHSFGGAHDALYDAMQDALDWIGGGARQ